jgi:CTP synthase (UTP-ammonia lyase)
MVLGVRERREECPADIRVGVIGEFDPSRVSHVATNEALGHAAAALGVTVRPAWLPTPALAEAAGEAMLRECDALWCSPGSPYASMDGALRAIRFARENGWPFVGT